MSPQGSHTLGSWFQLFPLPYFREAGGLIPHPTQGQCTISLVPTTKGSESGIRDADPVPWGRPPCAEPWPSSLASPLASMRMSEAGSDPAPTRDGDYAQNCQNHVWKLPVGFFFNF